MLYQVVKEWRQTETRTQTGRKQANNQNQNKPRLRMDLCKVQAKKAEQDQRALHELLIHSCFHPSYKNCKNVGAKESSCAFRK